jgi:hypothetical protein
MMLLILTNMKVDLAVGQLMTSLASHGDGSGHWKTVARMLDNENARIKTRRALFA